MECVTFNALHSHNTGNLYETAQVKTKSRNKEIKVLYIRPEILICLLNLLRRTKYIQSENRYF